MAEVWVRNEEPMAEFATVIADSGSTVNMRTKAKNTCISSIGLPQNRKNFSLFSDLEFRIFGTGHGKQRESTGNFASCVGTDPLPA